LSLTQQGFPRIISSKSSIHDPVTSGMQDTARLVPLNRLPRMVHEYFVEHVRKAEQVAEKRRLQIRSEQDAAAYVKEIRTKIQQCLGPWPDKTPLNSRITGILKRDVYNIEKVIFDSRPGFPVTANLYVPKSKKKDASWSHRLLRTFNAGQINPL